MKNLEILLPLCGKPKYLDRMKAFQRYGIVNHEGQSVHIKALIGTEDKSIFEAGWAQDIEFINSPYEHVAQKIYGHYANLTEADIEDCKWFIRVDDDSSTNIAGLLKWLEQFDYQEPHYFATRMCWGLPDFYITEAEKVGAHDLLPVNGKSKNGGFVPYVPHEWECSLVSQAMMRRIIRHQKAMAFLKGIEAIEHGWGDMNLAVAARMTGIAIAEVESLTAHPDVHNYSPLGGDIHHIHFIAPDLDYWKYFTEKMQENGY